ncbi:hypothetical protein IAR55_003805 [Kwoniella newhampshirensis]|uniref:Arrestin C-terminal-like domain-containing protein n=1 Tax=Kwoniella newhampshirensis TaxID=1651941 RepID=A0AAW0YY95_9TREE
MSHPARLSLRAPPHLPFIQGFPGIPPAPNRKPAGVHGTLELRVGNQPVKAKWVRVELRKHESLPPGFPSPASSSGAETTWEHVGSIQTLWKPGEGEGEWGTVETADFKFFLPLPENIPPSIDLPKNTGVRYELVAALCYRQKGGLFKKESSAIVKVSEQLRITKHELHSAWPIYNSPDSKTIQAANGSINLTVSRPNRAFASGDSIQFTATTKSARPQPFKLKGFECTLYEVIISIPIPPELTSPKSSKKQKTPSAPIAKARPVASVRAAVDESVGLGGDKSARIEMLVDRALVSVKGARTLEVAYELEVRAVTEGLKDKVEMGGIRYVVGPFMRSHAQQAVRDIGHVDALCPGVPRSTASSPGLFPASDPATPPISQRPTGATARDTYSPNQIGYPPQSQYQPQNIQGFVPRNERRQSFATTATTDTTTTATHEFGGPPQRSSSGRGYNTMPNQRRDMVTFPSPNPSRPRSTETTPASPVDSLQERFTQSELGHGSRPDDYNKRYSTGTNATFGRWDKGLKSSMESGSGAAGGGTQLTSLAESDITMNPASPVRAGSSRPAAPPSSFTYLTAEQEKRRQQELYDSARARAAQVQEASGASLDRIGLSPTQAHSQAQALALSQKTGIEDAEPPPPEYAPPRPAQPDKAYVAPSRPVSTYTQGNAGSPDAGGATNDDEDNRHPEPENPPLPPTVLTQTGSNPTYMSAVEEKEAQRKRFEAATGRVASGSGSALGHNTSAQNSPALRHASQFGSPSIPQTSAPGTPAANFTSDVPQESPIPYDAIFASSTDNGAGTSTSNGRQPVPAKTSSVLSEKEQMRRYYEAQDRVAAASQRTGGSVDGHDVGLSSATTLSTPARAGSSTGTTAQISALGRVGTAMGAVNEKEQMRRYYEAQERVAAAAAQGSPVASGSGGGGGILIENSPQRHNNQSNAPIQSHNPFRANQAQSHSRSTPVPAPSSSTSGPAGAVSSASDEKEQMRRYYEAMDRVQRASESGGENSGGRGLDSQRGQSRANSPTQAPPVFATPLDPIGGSSTADSAGLPGYTKTNSSKQNGGGGFMSAEEEKDLMRQRFESAQKAVRQQSNPTSPLSTDTPRGSNGPRTSLGATSMVTPPHSISSHERGRPTPTPSGHGHNGPRTGSTTASPSEPDSPLIRDPTVKAGKARAVTATARGGSDDGHAAEGAPPPPPLPARPPREYINLLSPVGERGE